MKVQVSSNYKIMAVKAIFAITMFIVTYFTLVTLAVVMTVFSVILGVVLIVVFPTLATIITGIGLTGIGIFVLIFLFKFIFKRYKVDRSHLVEIFEKDEPKLFSFIREIVTEVKTNFPKRVYLSSDVNACVFYDSSFWSMIFPIRKNLQIGLGLVNAMTEQEFKAILAHEFGHFSQRSMKVGSYVYNVNLVLSNLLYDSESFEKTIQKWTKFGIYFIFFVFFANKIIQGIQWVLKKMYEFVNVSYMALSREMEFHADKIAANVAGYLPLKESLLRTDLAEHSLNVVLNYYYSKISENITSKNIYKEQQFVMNFLASQNNLSFKNNLPVVTELDLSRFNKSKLIIKNQWASHPSKEERIKALELNQVNKTSVDSPAILLFENAEKIQEKITEKLFSSITYTNYATSLDFEEFKTDYLQTYIENSFPIEYNGYYDNKNPFQFDVDSIVDFNITETMDELFSKEKVDMVYDYIALESDKNVLLSIANKEYNIRTFDYNGKKYKSTEARNVISEIEKEQDNLRDKIKENDVDIFRFFYKEAQKKGNAIELKEKYINFFNQDSKFDNQIAVYNKIANATIFLNIETPLEQIRRNLKNLQPLEIELKKEIKTLLEDEILRKEISQQTIENYEKYLSKEWEYFSGTEYYEDNLQTLLTAINDFYYHTMRKYFNTKLDLLNFQIAQLK